jgi:hypothetical protein
MSNFKVWKRANGAAKSAVSTLFGCIVSKFGLHLLSDKSFMRQVFSPVPPLIGFWWSIVKNDATFANLIWYKRENLLSVVNMAVSATHIQLKGQLGKICVVCNIDKRPRSTKLGVASWFTAADKRDLVGGMVDAKKLRHFIYCIYLMRLCRSRRWACICGAH